MHHNSEYTAYLSSNEVKGLLFSLQQLEATNTNNFTVRLRMDDSAAANTKSCKKNNWRNGIGILHPVKMSIDLS